MKRFWWTTVALALVFALAAGCDDGGDGSGDSDKNGDSRSAEDATTNGEDGTLGVQDGVATAGDAAADDVADNPEDAYVPPPLDTYTPPKDVYTPPEDTYTPPPQDVQQGEDCGGQGPCPAGQECCDMMGQKMCLPEGQCQGGGEGCQSDGDCPDGQTCCPGMIPGTPGSCAAECGGLGDLPTCGSDADCVGGQTCKDLMGMAAICISECETEADCGGAACNELGAFGFSLAKVCDCAVDEDCGEGLTCCTLDIPMMGAVNTCLEKCFDLGELLPF